MFWSGISKLISIMLDSFQDPLNILEKYPDYKRMIKKKKFSYSCFNIHSISVFVEILTSPPYLTQVDFMEVPLLSQGTDTNVTVFPIQEQGLINVS